MENNVSNAENIATKAPKKKKFKWWSLLIFVVAVGIIVNALGSNDKKDASKPKEPTSQSEDTSENKAQALLDDAAKDYDNAKYVAMREKCDEILADYPGTTVAKNVSTFIAEKNAAAVQVSAVDLCKLYSDNEVKADKTYKDKLIVVTGKIDDIGKDVLGVVYVTLSDGLEYSFSNAHFSFDADDEITKVAELQKGNDLKIIGKCTGLSVTSASFTDCYIVE